MRKTRKKDMIQAAAKASGRSQSDCTAAFDLFLDILTRIGKQKGAVQIRGFGTFYGIDRAARVGVNVRHYSPGEVVAIPAHRTLAWKPSPEVKLMMNPRERIPNASSN